MGGNGQGMLVLPLSGARCEVYGIGLLKSFRGTGSDPVAYVIAYSWSSEGYWAWVEPTKRWYL